MDISPQTTPELFLPESRTEEIYPVVAVLMVVGATAVGLRFYSRAVVIRNVGVDDWLALVSVVFLFALGAGTFVMANQGLGKHLGLLPQPDGFKEFMRTFWVVIILYNLNILCVRLCFLAQYYRIMALKNMRRAVAIVAGLVTAWSLSQILLSIFQCTPISGFWDRGPDTKCVTSTVGWYMNASGNIISDIIVLLLPLPMIKGLKLPRNQKIALSGIFCLGFFTCAISIIRIQYLMVELDIPWVTADAQFWSVAEVCSGIVCSALPTLRPLLGKWLPRIFGSRIHVSSGYHSGSNRKPKDVESSGVRSRGTRRGTKQFSRSGGEGDEELMVGPAEHEAGGTAFLTLSDSSIELQERPNPTPGSDDGSNNSNKNNAHNDDDESSSTDLSYPKPVYASPVAGSPRRSADGLGDEASQMGRTKRDNNSVIQVRHDIEIHHDR